MRESGGDDRVDERSRLKAGTTLVVWRQSSARISYASPAVSNIAASMASAADLPAHTTNWNAW